MVYAQFGMWMDLTLSYSSNEAIFKLSSFISVTTNQSCSFECDATNSSGSLPGDNIC